MNSFGNQAYPRLAKAILAIFAIVVVAGPVILRSADRKTRSHFTATAGRPGQESSQPKEKNAASARDRAALEKRLAEAERAQRNLEKRLQEQERKSRKELERRLKEEARIAEMELAAQAKANKEAAKESDRGDMWSFVPRGLRSPFVMKRKEEPFQGYLAYREPHALRFTEDYRAGKRAPSPALPEFSMMTPNRDVQLSETRLSEKEIKQNELLRQAVVRLEPHIIVSGSIDTTIPRTAMESEQLVVEEEAQDVLRKEEVLIFFENQSGSGNTRTIIPQFTPAVPNEQPSVDSKANYRVE